MLQPFFIWEDFQVMCRLMMQAENYTSVTFSNVLIDSFAQCVYAISQL